MRHLQADILYQNQVYFPPRSFELGFALRGGRYIRSNSSLNQKFRVFLKSDIIHSMPDQAAQQREPASPNAGRGKQEAEKTLVEWTAPARPFKRRDRDFYITVVAIAGIFGLILFLVEGFLPVILIISLVFLFYVLSTVEPDKISYTITTRGIKIAARRTDWGVMGRFWFTKRFDSQLLVIETAVFPGRLEVEVDPNQKTQIQKAVEKYLTHEEDPASGLDRVANWLGSRLPGNK